MENEGARKEKHARGKRRSETLNTREFCLLLYLGQFKYRAQRANSWSIIRFQLHRFGAISFLAGCFPTFLIRPPMHCCYSILFHCPFSLNFFFFPTYFYFSFYFPTYFSFSSYFPTYFSFFFLFFYLFFFFFFFFFFHLFFHIFLFSLCTPLFKASNLILLPRVSLASSGLSLQPAAERTGKLHSNCRETQLFCPRSIGQLVPS